VDDLIRLIATIVDNCLRHIALDNQRRGHLAIGTDASGGISGRQGTHVCLEKVVVERLRAYVKYLGHSVDLSRDQLEDGWIGLLAS